MDINQAVIELKKVELAKSQIEFLRGESKRTIHDEWGQDEYADSCNHLANELILALLENK